MRLAITSLVASTLCGLTGCLLRTPGDDGDTTPPPVATGDYRVASTLDITVEALLPEPAEQLVQTMRDFSTNPAHALISLAGDAGVPAVATIQAVLPSYLEDKLEGWMNDEINKLQIDGLTVRQLAAQGVALAETTLTSVTVDSELTIGDGSATHRLVAVDFAPAGIDARIELGAVPGEIVTATVPVTTSGTTISFGDHEYSVAYGEYAWRAIDGVVVAEHGGGIRVTLGAAVNCPLIASRVANKCVLGACVGHASDLTELCERGLDEVVDRAHAKVAELRFDALHFAAGHAKMVDTDQDLVADQLVAGTWTAEINAGLGLRRAPATFTASR